MVACDGRVEQRARPSQASRSRSALERQGAVVFQAMQCRNCHSLGHEAVTADRLSMKLPAASHKTS